MEYGGIIGGGPMISGPSVGKQRRKNGLEEGGRKVAGGIGIMVPQGQQGCSAHDSGCGIDQ